MQLEEKEPRPFDGVVAHGVEEWVDEHLGGDKAISTEKAYVSSWAKWKAWARRQGWTSRFWIEEKRRWLRRTRSSTSWDTLVGWERHQRH